MARKKIEPIKFVEHTYYVYYDIDTGAIISVSNELKDTYPNKLIVDYSIYDSFVSGKELFSNWVVIRSKNPDLVDCMELVPKYEEQIYLKNNLFIWMPPADSDEDDTELRTKWNSDESQWDFSIGSSLITKVHNNKFVLPAEISFYVTLNNNLDFLIREIKFNPRDLLSGRVSIPFEFEDEYQISKIGLATRRIFNSYSLVIK